MFLAAAYIGLISMVQRMAAPSFFNDVFGRQDPTEYAYLHTTNKELGISPFQMILLNTAYLEVPIIATFFIFLFRKVLPFRKDIRCGVKEKVPYQIIRKEYFPLTNEYYVALDDPDYMHHKLDEATYSQVNEGDNMYLYRAIYSKYVFEINGRYTIM